MKKISSKKKELKNMSESDLIQRVMDLEQFTYIVSHNLRSPIANIKGLSALLQNYKLDSEAYKKCIVGLETSVKRLDSVITDLDQILQAQAEILEKRKPVKLSNLIKFIKADLKDLIEKNKVTITTDFSVDNIKTVKSYVHSIFYNLISNSIKYRDPEKNAVIAISSKKEGKKVILVFKDNGLGIDLGLHRDKIFELYKRFHTNVEGKGLGLFMVKTQVETLGGKVSVKSKPGKGAEFTVELEQ